VSSPRTRACARTSPHKGIGRKQRPVVYWTPEQPGHRTVGARGFAVL